MRILKALRGVPVVLASTALLLAVAGVVLASEGSPPEKVCVPEKARKPLLTPTNGLCKTGYTLTEVGNPGPEGKQGPEGKEGKEGHAEPAVIARARDVASVATVSSPASIEDPLSDGAWTQGAEEVDQLVGQITIGIPSRAECSGGEGSPARLTLHVLLDGTQVAGLTLLNITSGHETLPLEWESPARSSDWLLEPGTATTHTLTVRAEDTCGYGGGQSSGHFTVQSVDLDVLGAR